MGPTGSPRRVAALDCRNGRLDLAHAPLQDLQIGPCLQFRMKGREGGQMFPKPNLKTNLSQLLSLRRRLGGAGLGWTRQQHLVPIQLADKIHLIVK